jgi:dTMP kinase
MLRMALLSCGRSHISGDKTFMPARRARAQSPYAGPRDLKVPPFVIFEGVDGAGKSALSRRLAQYYQTAAPGMELYYDNFPGSLPGTLGEWVYRVHHGRATDAPSPDMIAPPALQLLHVAAHVDTILSRITPTLARGGRVILDRYWWSTYAYSRRSLPPEKVWNMVAAERTFWADLPAPAAIYLSRANSLKSAEIDEKTHREIDSYYREVIAHEAQSGVEVHHISNEGALEQAFLSVLDALRLPARPSQSS